MATLNSLRYRGYVYDNETELYYLQSRYYDPQTGRFLNSDVYCDTQTGSPLSTNSFSYCENNSVNYVDYSGEWHETYKKFKIISKGFQVKVSLESLSRPFCLSYAQDFLEENSDGITWFGQKTYSEMTKKRIAKELWFHALAYYCLKPIKKILKNFDIKIKKLNEFVKRAKMMHINSDDKYAWVFTIVWNSASWVKFQISVSGVPKAIKYLTYIIL